MKKRRGWLGKHKVMFFALLTGLLIPMFPVNAQAFLILTDAEWWCLDGTDNLFLTQRYSDTEDPDRDSMFLVIFIQRTKRYEIYWGKESTRVEDRFRLKRMHPNQPKMKANFKWNGDAVMRVTSCGSGDCLFRKGQKVEFFRCITE